MAHQVRGTKCLPYAGPTTSERPVFASRYFFGGRAAATAADKRSSVGAQREVGCTHHASLHRILHSYPMPHCSVGSVLNVVLDLKCTGWMGGPECCCPRAGPLGMVRSDLLHQNSFGQGARSATADRSPVHRLSYTWLASALTGACLRALPSPLAFSRSCSYGLESADQLV